MRDAHKETRAIERNALIATGVIWSWLAVNRNVHYDQLKWLPAILVFLSAFQALGIASNIKSN
jgi:hypothetical protein